MNDFFEITVFDDGNKRFATYANIWQLHTSCFSLPEGKICLKNVEDNRVIIESISAWKVLLINKK